MTRDELLKTLQSLHHELASATNLDEETRRMLQLVTDDIHARLNQPSSAAGTEDSLADRMRQTVVQFETQHPQLTLILERLTDGLAKLGI